MDSGQSGGLESLRPSEFDPHIPDIGFKLAVIGNGLRSVSGTELL